MFFAPHAFSADFDAAFAKAGAQRARDWQCGPLEIGVFSGSLGWVILTTKEYARPHYY